MNRGVFRELVQSICKYSGHAYLSDSADLNGLINERLRSFAAQTRCLFDDRIPFTLSASGDAGVYDLFGSALSRDVLEVHRLYIDGKPLSNFQGKYGPASLEEVAHYHPSYLTDSHDRPRVFWHRPPRSLCLYPAPDQAYGDCFVSGWYLPASITTHTSGDTQELEIPEEYQRVAAYWTSSALLVPTSTGQSDYERLAVLNLDAAAFMQELAGRSRRLLDGPSVRGAVRYRSGI